MFHNELIAPDPGNLLIELDPATTAVVGTGTLDANGFAVARIPLPGLSGVVEGEVFLQMLILDNSDPAQPRSAFSNRVKLELNSL